MKISLILLLITISTTKLFSQEKNEHYSVSGGLLGAVNFAHFSAQGNNPRQLVYRDKISYGGGLWVNFPVAPFLSIETQGIFSTYRYEPVLIFGTEFEGSMNFVSVPLFLKFYLAKQVALTAGTQFDFLISAKDANKYSTKSDYRKSSTSLTGGIEIMPRSRITFFGRYMHGLTNIENRGDPEKPTLYNRIFQGGVKFKLFGGYTQEVVPTPLPPPVVAAPVDTDADGISDAEDKCPSQKGLAKYNGCPIPDSDEDGINDEEDKCPNQKGMAKYAGCPIPDSDEDGINDEEDKCPKQSGVARYGGCPVPDTDGDGVNDEEDRCPTVAGTADNKGCPVIENFQANEVTFASGKTILTPSGKKELDLAVSYLKKYPAIKVQLNGYTDNSGSDKMNNSLSSKRAEAAMKYLVSKGINAARISFEGHGSEDPVADNKTKTGKAKNRRVEIVIQ